MSNDKRLLIWCGDAPNQRALANKIARQFNVCGIVIDRKLNGKKQSFFKRILPALQDRLFFSKITESWSGLQHSYANDYSHWPDTKQITVDSINSAEAYDFTQQLSPDLVIVSGTGLVRSKMLSLKPSIGIINLHTGLSPYIKGGPNCTNWCISTGQYEKIGNTIMWISKGIDSGNIIASECTELGAISDLKETHYRVMEHAHDLYLRAIRYLLNNTPPYNSIPQKDIGEGKLYLTKMWTFHRKRKLLRNLPAFFRKEWKKKKDNDLVTVSIQ